MLTYASYNINSIMTTINKYKEKRIKIDTNNKAFDIHKEKVLIHMDRLKRFVKELDLLLSFQGFEKPDVYGLIETQIDAIEQCTTNTLLINCINTINNTIEGFNYNNKHTYSTCVDDDRSNNIASFQPNKINAMFQNIKLRNNRKVNYLNPCIFIRNEDMYIKDMFTANIELYGIVEEDYIKPYYGEPDIEFDESIYEKLIRENNNVINDDSIKTNTRISNSTFDIMNIQPKISTVNKLRNDLYSLPAKEIVALRDNYKYLRPNGVMIYTIPFTRMTYEVMLFLSKNFINISIIKSTQKDQLDNVTIIGQKQTVREYEEEYSRLKHIKYEDLEDTTDTIYYLPTEELTVDLFRGGYISPAEMQNIISTDGLYNEFYKQVDDHKILTDTQPLLPFNIGQVGLVLTSGRLDGVIEEPGDRYHIIKGRTIKYTENIQNNIENNEERVKKISNRVQIKAFGADGTFKSIS